MSKHTKRHGKKMKTYKRTTHKKYHKRRYSKKQRGGSACSTPLGSSLVGGRPQKGGGCGCSSGGLTPSLVGGRKRYTRKSRKHRGGSSSLVGKPWSSNIGDWPGVSGEQGVTNHYALNKYTPDIQTAMRPSRGGGRKRKGGFANGISKVLPAPLANVGRDLEYGMGSAYNNINGYPAPVNPTPYEQPNL